MSRHVYRLVFLGTSKLENQIWFPHPKITQKSEPKLYAIRIRKNFKNVNSFDIDVYYELLQAVCLWEFAVTIDHCSCPFLSTVQAGCPCRTSGMLWPKWYLTPARNKIRLMFLNSFNERKSVSTSEYWYSSSEQWSALKKSGSQQSQQDKQIYDT